MKALFTLYGLLFRVYIYIGFFVPKLLNGGKTFLRDSQYYVNRIKYEFIKIEILKQVSIFKSKFENWMYRS